MGLLVLPISHGWLLLVVRLYPATSPDTYVPEAMYHRKTSLPLANKIAEPYVHVRIYTRT